MQIPASATSDFTITGTDIGIFARTGTSMSAARVGDVLPNGAAVAVECEAFGELVDNGYAPSDVWMQLSDGTFLPNAFVYTGADGRTPGVPLCGGQAEPGATPESAEPVAGAYIVNDGAIYNQLLNHYYDKTGTPVNIDWTLFSTDVSFVEWARSLSLNNTEESYASSSANDGFDMWASLGTFAVRRTSEHCFVVRDVYDFNIMSPEVVQALDGLTGAARTFEVNASGCL
jgi:hypothetical protein